jgi:hypothetical protein
MNRLADLVRFYGLLDQLERRLGGTRTLASFNRHRDWPQRGLYLFFEPSEMRLESGHGPRIVRVGTHALSAGSRSTLRQRLGQHRGLASGGGNHGMRNATSRLQPMGQMMDTWGDGVPHRGPV